LVPFIGVIVFTGIYPKPMLERIEPAVDALIAHVEHKTGFESPQPASVVMIDHVEAPAATNEEEGE
jgi:NADH-quinone oxidoreductase subunit M